MGHLVRKVCGICSNEFFVKPSQIKLGWGKYCSIECHHKSQKTGINVDCFICGKKIYKCPAELAHSISSKFFCSKKCQAIWRNKYYSGNKNTNWKGGVQTYRDILVRSGQKRVCAICKIENTLVLVAHHIDHNRKNNNVSNLIWLCMNCHYLVHHNERLDKTIKNSQNSSFLRHI